MGKNRNGPKVNFPVNFVGNRMLFGNPTREQEEHEFHSNDDDLFDED
jgi:hypothetical protein